MLVNASDFAGLQISERLPNDDGGDGVPGNRCRIDEELIRLTSGNDGKIPHVADAVGDAERSGCPSVDSSDRSAAQDIVTDITLGEGPEMFRTAIAATAKIGLEKAIGGYLAWQPVPGDSAGLTVRENGHRILSIVKIADRRVSVGPCDIQHIADRVEWSERRNATEQGSVKRRFRVGKSARSAGIVKDELRVNRIGTARINDTVDNAFHDMHVG